MKIEFYGAAGCVTGSCHIVRIKDKNVLLDCGLYQGKDENDRGNDIFNFDPRKIDYVILSHAHIDHSGRIPFLFKRGFKGEVICTDATKDLCNVMLPDSGHIQEMELEWKNRKRIRQGLPAMEPLYTSKIAELSLYLFKSYPYDQMIDVFDGLRIRFRDAGHLLGSAIVEMFIKEEGNKEIKLVYTGDLGNVNIPIIKDPTYIEEADYVLMETTYGNRLHGNIDTELAQLVKIIKDTFKRGGNVIIPSFSVGRTQEVLYALNRHIERKELDNMTVYVDSPLAYESTKVFQNHTENYDTDAQKIINSGNDPLSFDGLVFTKSAEDSAKINKIQSGALVISASGMCEAGRIKHHLKHNLWRKECSIVFVGYQAEGTLGRTILEGAKKVKIFGEDIAVNASIYNLQGLSGHADRKGLIKWVEALKKKPKEIILVHGDEESRNSFKELLETKGFKCRKGNLGENYVINEKITGEERDIRNKIIKLLYSVEDINNTSKEELLEKIKNIMYS